MLRISASDIIAIGTNQNNGFFLSHIMLIVALFFFFTSGTSVSANDGRWHHICATWENTAGSWKLYKDGAVGDQGQGLQKGNIHSAYKFSQALKRSSLLQNVNLS